MGTLRDADMRGVTRLLGEVAQLHTGHAAKRRALMQGLNRLIDAETWVAGHGTIANPQRLPVLLSIIHEGISEDWAVAMVKYALDVERPLREHRCAGTLVETGEHQTRRRDQLIADEVWYGAAVEVDQHRQMGYDDFLISCYPIEGDGLYSVLAFFRGHGRSRFSDRDCQLLHLVAAEVPWLHHPGAPAQPHHRVSELTPRLQTVLALLLDGRDRKSIARMLGLSCHTVSEYMKRVYGHFGVNGQVALLRRFMAGLEPIPHGEGGARSDAADTPPAAAHDASVAPMACMSRESTIAAPSITPATGQTATAPMAPSAAAPGEAVEVERHEASAGDLLSMSPQTAS